MEFTAPSPEVSNLCRNVDKLFRKAFLLVSAIPEQLEENRGRTFKGTGNAGYSPSDLIQG